MDCKESGCKDTQYEGGSQIFRIHFDIMDFVVLKPYPINLL